MTAAEFDRVPHIIGADYNLPIARSLERTWEAKPGILGWISLVGVRNLVTAFIFLILGGYMALVMRLQLVRPHGTTLTSQQYNELFSAHAITMIFLYAQPVLSGFSNYLFPLVPGGGTRHGIPAHEHVLLLAVPGGWSLHVQQHSRGR